VKKPSREVDTCKGFGKSLPGLGKKALRCIRRTQWRSYSRVSRSRNALPTTLTDDSAIAAAAMIGDSSRPNVG
jgi:hypothetical protein